MPYRGFCSVLIGLMLLTPNTPVPAEETDLLKVVATFSIIGDMISNIGEDDIVLTTLVGANGDAHVYEPTPADARALAEADLVIANGLEFEGWIDRLIAASGYTGPLIIASDGIEPLKADTRHGHAHLHGHALDPHAWQDLSNARQYVANITQALAAADPARTSTYQRRQQRYDQALAALDTEIRERLATVPEDRRTVVTSHDAFGYFGRAYNIDFRAPVGLSTDSEPSAQQLASLIRQMRNEGIQSLFLENITNPRLVQQLAREADVVVGGTLYSDSLSSVDGPAATYIDMFRHNVQQLLSTLALEDEPAVARP